MLVIHDGTTLGSIPANTACLAPQTSQEGASVHSYRSGRKVAAVATAAVAEMVLVNLDVMTKNLGWT